MLNKDNLTHNINEKMSSQFNGSRLAHKSCHILIYATVMVMCLGVLLFLVPDTANAGEVYGRIKCSGCSSRILLIFKKGDRVIKEVRADDRTYGVYLSPGNYDVEIKSNGMSESYTVRSLSGRNRQDINISLNPNSGQ